VRPPRPIQVHAHTMIESGGGARAARKCGAVVMRRQALHMAWAGGGGCRRRCPRRAVPSLREIRVRGRGLCRLFVAAILLPGFKKQIGSSDQARLDHIVRDRRRTNKCDRCNMERFFSL
jgi:hypothetical protein